MRRQWVHRENSFVQERKAIRSVELARPNTDAGGRNKKSVDAITRTAQFLVGMSKVSLVPKMDSSLIGCLNGDAKVAKYSVDPGLNTLLTQFAGVREVEIEEVVILDPRLRRTAVS